MLVELIQQIWPQWTLVEQLGKGSYGTVYKAVRNDTRIQATAAIKAIPVPQDASEHRALRSEGMTEEETRTYFKGIVDDFVEEIALMESFKGMQNIVSIEDYQVVENPETDGWLILVRMELLTPFVDYLVDHEMTEDDVIRLGIDICSALEICSSQNIIHRDIKPENIFVNKFGYFKLGDFGIAKRFENMAASHSQKGTYNYMAPEVANGTHYDARVDIYSLGLVLYRLMNQNNLPFITSESRMSPSARKRALERRLIGEELPRPSEASNALSDIILKACAYKVEERFESADILKKTLEEIQKSSEVVSNQNIMNAGISAAQLAQDHLGQDRRLAQQASMHVPQIDESQEETTNLRNKHKAVSEEVPKKVSNNDCQETLEDPFVDNPPLEEDKASDIVEIANEEPQDGAMFEKESILSISDHQVEIIEESATVTSNKSSEPNPSEERASTGESESSNAVSSDSKNLDETVSLHSRKILSGPSDKDASDFSATIRVKKEKEQNPDTNTGRLYTNTKENKSVKKKFPLKLLLIPVFLLAIGAGLLLYKTISSKEHDTSGTDAASMSKDIEETTAESDNSAEVQIGDIIKFGFYEQDNDTSNGKEGIEWLVLAKESDKALVISKYALDCQRFDASLDKVWDTSRIRAWLNSTFLDAAFSNVEQNSINNSYTIDREMSSYTVDDYSTDTDKVFLLSIKEADQLFTTDILRRCVPSAFAINQGAGVNPSYRVENNYTCSWWLRSSGRLPTCEAFVNTDGSVNSSGDTLNRNTYAVRPAMWINLSPRIATNTITNNTDAETKSGIGDIIILGSYEQDNVLTNGKEPIEWIVIRTAGSTRYIVSKYILDCQPYNEKAGSASWGDTSLKVWLNQNFLFTAFSKEEQALLIDTNEKGIVFLLDKSEVGICDPAYPTSYARSLGGNSAYLWWIKPEISTHNKGYYVDGSDKQVYASKNLSNLNGIRPALWIDISKWKDGD